MCCKKAEKLQEKELSPTGIYFLQKINFAFYRDWFGKFGFVEFF